MIRDTMTVAHIIRPITAELKQVRTQLEHQLAEIDEHAITRFAEITANGVHHLFSVHGKFLRPSLVLLSALAIEEDNNARNELIHVSTALELIHSASLVHDDVIDHAETRRDQPTLNREYGNKFAVLIGDLLYDQAFALITAVKELGAERQLRLFELFTSTTRKMCLGELYEDEIAKTYDGVRFDDYLKVIDYKTASLMACCCEASAIVVGASDEERRAIASYGYHLGMAYQLVDDVNDNDSVFYDQNTMIDRAIGEAEAAKRSLVALQPGRFAERLGALPDSVVRRAMSTARV